MAASDTGDARILDDCDSTALGRDLRGRRLTLDDFAAVERLLTRTHPADRPPFNLLKPGHECAADDVLAADLERARSLVAGADNYAYGVFHRPSQRLVAMAIMAVCTRGELRRVVSDVTRNESNELTRLYGGVIGRFVQSAGLDAVFELLGTERFAVMNMSNTDPEFRRRGLNSQVAGRLYERAASFGCDFFVLFAVTAFVPRVPGVEWQTLREIAYDDYVDRELCERPFRAKPPHVRAKLLYREVGVPIAPSSSRVD